MHVVVAYDVVEDRRRNRLAKLLTRYLIRVQKSVFEGDIRYESYREMMIKIHDEIDHLTDSVRVYHLCERCKKVTDIVGVAIWTPEEEGDEVY